METNKKLIEDFSGGDRRALSRLITLAENQDESIYDTLTSLYPKVGQAKVIGITGLPGSGKSTIVSHFIKYIRQKKETVFVTAIDPMSPFTGGALLGDRIRLSDHFNDPGVFIRSLSTRGKLGGLSLATKEVVHLADAFGMNYILIETVGVGQNEVDVRDIADINVVVLVPESGDGIQTLKAGVLEIGDFLVVNKSDREGAGKLVSELKSTMEDSLQKHTEVMATSTKDPKSLVQLFQSIDNFFSHQENQVHQRRQSRAQTTIKDMLQTIVTEQAFQWIARNMPKETNPYHCIKSFLKAHPVETMFPQ